MFDIRIYKLTCFSDFESRNFLTFDFYVILPDMYKGFITKATLNSKLVWY